MSTPEYGAHIYDPATGEYQPANGSCPEQPGEVTVPMRGAVAAGQDEFMIMPECVEVPRGVGRSLFSQYDSSGYDVYRRILESGHFYEQMGAMVALQTSNASVVGIGQDVNADARTFRIPYNLVFGPEVEGLFSSVYNEVDPGYAMHISRNGAVGQVVQRSLFNELDPDQVDQLPVIAPGRTYTTRVQALVAGMNLLDSSLNPAYAQRGQIALVGSGAQLIPPETIEAVELQSEGAHSTPPITATPWTPRLHAVTRRLCPPRRRSASICWFLIRAWRAP
jgi:hypothetical protein